MLAIPWTTQVPIKQANRMLSNMATVPEILESRVRFGENQRCLQANRLSLFQSIIASENCLIASAQTLSSDFDSEKS